ncbi:S9 family peptidase [Henriciella aquimarina]|uniref:S9 family peptidase n=1 Tax=Henriciella aquimarina TaxID=545261 RepID=UPI001F160721|nr:DPP IV N-terminal domain-containing protein [Henriciella aquimarina]
MKPVFAGLAALFSVSACAGAGALAQSHSKDAMPSQELTLERLYTSPSLNGPSATGVKYAPDGKRVTFLKAREDDSSRYDLWQFDVATGAQSMLVDSTLLQPDDVELSEEEKALRERKRIAGRKGIVDYDWGTADTLLVPLGGDLYLVTLTASGPTVRQLTETEAFEYDARLSPDGSYVSFIRDGAVHVIDLASGAEQQITPDAEPEKAISYGTSEFVAQEEMSRYTGYWWSPDARYIAYTRVDESTVDIIPRFDIQADKTTVIKQRYPRAGRPNAIVDLYVRDMKTGEATKLYSVGPDTYLARVNWTPGSLWFQTVDRDQTEITYHRTDGKPWRIWSPLQETQEKWVNLSKDFVALDESVLLTSEKTGHRHIAVSPYGDPERLAFLTRGDWAVDEVKGIDRENRMVYFTGFADTPLEKHLYRTRLPWTEEELDSEDHPGALPGSNCIDLTPDSARATRECPAPERLTEAGKSWSITLAPDGKSFVGTSSSPTQPPQTGLYTVEGKRIAWIEENRLDADHPYAPYLAGHTVPDYGTLEAEDGQTLYYSIQTPPDFDASKQYPVIIEVYGGPHVQTVDRDWESMSDQYLTRQGYIVFRLDNRGMANRGKKFEDVIYRRTGGPEVRDQLAGVDWLKSQPFVDADRIAIQGWSYGGYMTLMTILQAPKGTFAAAAAGAPVTDWSLYDTFYTERYMDTPQDNPDGYEQSSVFAHAKNLTTPLLLMHGMADDNVTFDNMTRLMAAFQEMGKPFELMTYPGQRHGIRGAALQTHLMKTRIAFLNRHLKPDTSD